MKRIILAVSALIFTSSLCFAQQASTPVSKPAQSVSDLANQITPKQGEIMTFVGKVAILSLADVKKGTKTQISIEDEKGQYKGFVVKSSTAIYDKTGKRIGFSSITKGQKVVIEYKYGSFKARSIKLVE